MGPWLRRTARTQAKHLRTARVKDFSQHAFSYSSPATWNSVPTSIKNCSSLYSFKRHLKSHLTAQLINN